MQGMPNAAVAVAARPRKHFKPLTESLARKLCLEMADGKPMVEVCASLGVDKWQAYAALTDQHAKLYARTRELLAHKYAVEIIEIGDDESLDPQSRRVRCDNRKWAASKLLPKVYGDRQIVSGDPENPIEVKVQQMSPEERLAEARKLLEAIGKLALLSAPTIDNE